METCKFLFKAFFFNWENSFIGRRYRFIETIDIPIFFKTLRFVLCVNIEI